MNPRESVETLNDEPRLSNTCAVVVTFRPDNELPARISQLTAHARKIVIIDNGSGAEFAAILENARESAGASLISNPDNHGIAAALNQGVDLAVQSDFQWACLFDQDSTALPELLSAAQHAYDEFPAPDRIAVIGADHDHPFHFKKRNRFPGNRAYREMRTVITSGSLISLSIFQKIGGFREDLFIDSVDDEYCMRAREKGFAVIEATAFGIAHSIGKPKIVYFLGKPRSTSNHPPIRRYYMARNRLALSAKYLFREPLWSLLLWKSLFREVFFVIGFEENKAAKLKATLLGLLDALRSKVGKLDETRLANTTADS